MRLPPCLCVLLAARGPPPRGKGTARTRDGEGAAVVDEAAVGHGGGERGRCGGPRRVYLIPSTRSMAI
jgi:hypothetical protein